MVALQLDDTFLHVQMVLIQLHSLKVYSFLYYNDSHDGKLPQHVTNFFLYQQAWQIHRTILHLYHKVSYGACAILFQPCIYCMMFRDGS